MHPDERYIPTDDIGHQTNIIQNLDALHNRPLRGKNPAREACGVQIFCRFSHLEFGIELFPKLAQFFRFEVRLRAVGNSISVVVVLQAVIGIGTNNNGAIGWSGTS